MSDYVKDNIIPDILDIKLTPINQITDMSYMFYSCTTLISINGFSKLNTEDILNISFIFAGCSSLASLQIFLIGKLVILPL